MKAVFESAIARGGYDLPAMLSRIDGYHISGRLTDADRQELYALARQQATPAGEDLWQKVAALEQRLRALEQTVAEAEPFQAGKWYYAGDRVVWAGEVWQCAAPQGSVCVWDPEVYPSWWQKV